MDNIADILAKLDLAQLVAIGLMFWFFYSRLETKIDKLETKIDKLDIKITEIDKKVNDLDKRIFGIEIMLHTKDCCVLNDSIQNKKAE